MAAALPSISMVEDILKSCIDTMVSDIMEKHIKEAQEEIAEKLPTLIGTVSARVIQEMSKNSPLEPHYSIHVYNQQGVSK